MRGKKDVGKKQLIVNNFEDKILPLAAGKPSILQLQLLLVC